MPDSPQDLAGLFRFYCDFVKPLYSEIQTSNVLPNEVLFELNAAFDHISRRWSYSEPEPLCVDKAYSHLKRSCLDIFKLKVKAARDQYDELKQIDLSLIDNGAFEGKMRQAFRGIKEGAKSARCSEGRKVELDQANEIFEFWLPVYERCINFEKEFYENPNIEWAKKVVSHYTVKKTLWTVLISAVVTLVLREGIIYLYHLLFVSPTSLH